MPTSPRTTALGIITILTTLCGAAKAFLDNDPATVVVARVLNAMGG